jgi:hypothetical protein
VKVDDIDELSSSEFSCRLTSSEPIITERAMYFEYMSSIPGGHDTMGATSPAQEWYLAEGYTSGGFDTYVLLQNPHEEEASVRATFYTPDGEPLIRDYTIDPQSRYTIKVDEVEGLSSCEVSTMIETTNEVEIIAERSIYFTYKDKWGGGHNTMGVNEPSSSWYFAEGYAGY